MSKTKIEVNYYEAPGQNYQQQPSNNCQQQPNQNVTSDWSLNVMLVPLGFLFLLFFWPILLGGTRQINYVPPSSPVIINNR
jgi:hypothetical protein